MTKRVKHEFARKSPVKRVWNEVDWYCSSCEQTLPVESFYKEKNRYGVSYICKQCQHARRRDYLRKYPEKRKGYALKRDYGISHEQYMAMLGVQGFRCAICDEPQSTTRSFHVDHDHASGRIRGLLCHHCNAGLGMFKDDQQRLISAAQYLEHSLV